MKQLILTADDFGRSAEINAAILHAYRAGFVTQASLMVNELATEEAAQLARQNPKLCLGLHLTLCAGRAPCVSALTNAQGFFQASPARAGLRYFFSRRLAEPLRAEIHAQFARFRALGFAPTYWDGHAHLHLHPTILRLTLPIAAEFGFQHVRLVREPGPRTPLSLIFQVLSRAAVPRLVRRGFRFTDHLFGLRESGRMNTATVGRFLEKLPPGLSELYFHPGAEREEIDYPTLVPLFARHRITLRNSQPSAD